MSINTTHHMGYSDTLIAHQDEVRQAVETRPEGTTPLDAALTVTLDDPTYEDELHWVGDLETWVSEGMPHLTPATGHPTPVYRVAWTTTRGTMTCVLEEQATDGTWMDPEDATVASAEDGLQDGDDWEAPGPYAEARARLLATAGLTDSDVTEPDDTCW